MMQEQDVPMVLPYSTDAPSPKARIWAAAILMFGGLALVGLGGCFLIGVMVSNQTYSMSNAATPRVYFFLGVLYLMAFVCFASAGFLVVVSTRKLFQIIGG